MRSRDNAEAYEISRGEDARHNIEVEEEVVIIAKGLDTMKENKIERDVILRGKNVSIGKVVLSIFMDIASTQLTKNLLNSQSDDVIEFRVQFKKNV
jgi:hypothetical protein